MNNNAWRLRSLQPSLQILMGVVMFLIANVIQIQIASALECSEIKVEKEKLNVPKGDALEYQYLPENASDLTVGKVLVSDLKFPLVMEECGDPKYYKWQHGAKTVLVDKSQIGQICVRTASRANAMAGAPASGSSNICSD